MQVLEQHRFSSRYRWKVGSVLAGVIIKVVGWDKVRILEENFSLLLVCDITSIFDVKTRYCLVPGSNLKQPVFMFLY